MYDGHLDPLVLIVLFCLRIGFKILIRMEIVRLICKKFGPHFLNMSH